MATAKELQQELAGVDDLFRLCVHNHAFCDIERTGRLQCALLFNFDKAYSARTDRFKAGVIT